MSNITANDLFQDRGTIKNRPVEDFWLEIARGNVIGMQMFSIPGRKDSISSTLLDDISQIPTTTVIPDPGGIQMEIVSSSASDTSVGTGIQTLMLVYLDTTGIQQNEIITLNGITPVNTIATDIDKIQWIHTVTVGTNNVSVGNISLRNTAGTTTFEYISAGSNQSLSCRFHIPINTTGYILGWQASAVTKVVDFKLRATVMRANSILISPFVFQDTMILDATSSGWIPFNVPKKIPARGDIKISATSSAAGGDAGCQFDILIIDD